MSETTEATECGSGAYLSVVFPFIDGGSGIGVQEKRSESGGRGVPLEGGGGGDGEARVYAKQDAKVNANARYFIDESMNARDFVCNFLRGANAPCYPRYGFAYAR